MVESIVELTTVNRAEKAGWFCRKVTWMGRRDAPDRLFIKGGRTVWIEFKKPGTRDGDIPETQKREHDRMRARGAEVHVVASYWQAAEILGL